MSQPVPTYTTRTNRQSGQGIEYLNVQYSPDSFGAAVGRALSRAGQQIDGLAELVKKKGRRRRRLTLWLP